MAINFESNWEKDAQREETRKAREIILENAKSKYEREQRKKEQAKQRGEDTWMLNSVNERISNEAQALEKSKKKKKKDKKKKKKKEHKKKKKKDISSSDSDSDSECEPQWVEKKSEAVPGIVKGAIGPKMERADWMTAPLDLNMLPTVSRADLIAKKEKEKEEKRAQEELLNKPGQHERELNPYWKEGGAGIPEEDPSKKKVKSSAFATGGGGALWLKKALQRCEQQAEEEKKSLEEVAALRYGSLKKLKSMIKEAEDQASESSRLSQGRRDDPEKMQSQNRHFVRPRSRSQSPQHSKRISGSREREYESKNCRRDRTDYKNNRIKSSSASSSESDSDSKRKRSRSRDGKYETKHDRSRSRDRKYETKSGRSRSRDRKYQSESRNKERSRSRERKRYSRSRSRERMTPQKDSRSSMSHYASGSRSNIHSSHSSGLKSLSGKFRKPGHDKDESDEGYSKVPASKSKSSLFQKPREEDDSDSERKVTSSSRSSYRTSDRDRKAQPSWRKKEFMKPEEEDEQRKENVKVSDRAKKPESSASSDSSESSSSDEEENTISKAPEPAKVLTEQEMNQLGAKILKAEIMGNQSLADELKAQLAAAQTAKASGKSQTSGRGKPKNQAEGEDNADDDTEKVVVLTRTDKRGMVRPLGEREHAVEPRHGRRKKQKIETHSGQKGERERYFHDDDKYDLKKLVEQERMGTAEDSNMMFARLAGRSGEKTDDDYQVDDMFLSRANKNVSDSKNEEKDRYSAIMEHKKMSKSLDKCQFCFDKVPKHLIIAIGIKCYLALPNHTSLTDGHCLIVPMQHVTQATEVDEDVWDEIQVFRKGITKMFEDRDEDCVFMEMSRNVKYHPHMFIDCIPMEREIGDMAPVYFKKALMESESEWAENKKVIDISKKDIRHSVPKGFPYFSVDFGLQGGFAHVIEDEKEFPSYFGREIVGGMLDVGPTQWRKPHKENFEDQRKKVLSFAELWKPYDWTQKLESESKAEDSS